MESLHVPGRQSEMSRKAVSIPGQNRSVTNGSGFGKERATWNFIFLFYQSLNNNFQLIIWGRAQQKFWSSVSSMEWVDGVRFMNGHYSNSSLNLVESSEKLCCCPWDMNSFREGLRYVCKGHCIGRLVAGRAWLQSPGRQAPRPVPGFSAKFTFWLSVFIGETCIPYA